MTDWKFIFEKWALGRHYGWGTRFGWSDYLEPAVRDVVVNLQGDLFVDIGANIGMYSILLAGRFKEVYAFEPNPNNTKVLRWRTMIRHRNVRTFEMALTNFDGTVQLFLYGPKSSSHTILPVFDYKPDVEPSLRPPDTTFVGKDAFPVDARRFDSIVGRMVDLVKIDVEGAEFLVLEGMQDSIAKGRIKRIIVELHNRDRKDELLNLLSQYKQHWLDPSHLYCTLR